MEQIIMNIILSVGQVVMVDDTLTIIPFNEVIMQTAEECINAVSAINLKAVGEGIVAFCYTIPEKVIVQ